MLLSRPRVSCSRLQLRPFPHPYLFVLSVVCRVLWRSYMFDEPSSYLDVRQRLKAAHTIRSVCTQDKYGLLQCRVCAVSEV